jgi:L-amino acid N-acyltransferase YncA
VSKSVVSIRDFDEDDWPAVYEIFSEVVNEGDTYVYLAGVTPDEARGLWIERPPGQTVVAEVDGVILGTAKFGPNRPGRGAHVATASFMVRASSRGTGVGRALVEWGLYWARERGYEAMQFNAVVSTNLGAIELYRSLGFETIGTVPRAFEHKTLGRVGLDIMYVRL